ncbi:hypothetical protein NE237_006340 [Protea cynaroides]|uniref:Uncharacterized protein n=1 Tax=Protea cynaroides TaxID=273540 RepID=A0A9Q0KMB2_9MAGN|nr:hypothetical protein NE237_006340 [Protea cynaroides]
MSSPPWLLLMVLVMVSNGISTSKKLDELSLPGIKCTMCSCQNPFNQYNPPSLPPPPPPPPAPSPPPPPPSTDQYCPTPPPPPFYYFTGLPGSLYSYDLNYSGRDFGVGLAVLVGCQLLGMLVFWD